MKRTQDTYNTYQIYEEALQFNFLSPLEKLTFSSIYNLLSKGKGHLERGLMPNSFNQVVNQHRMVFGIDKQIKKVEWQKALDTLVDLDMLQKVSNYKERIEKFGKLITVERENYILGDNGKLQVSRAKDILKSNSSSTKSLF